MTTTPLGSKTSMIFAGEIFDGRDPEHPLLRDLGGDTHLVRIRAMPARHLDKVLQLSDNEAALLELVCQIAVKDEATGSILEWAKVDEVFVDNLDDLSHELAWTAAKRLNFTRAATWGKRQIAAREMKVEVMKDLDEVLSPVVKQMVGLLISSLPSAGSPAAPATKS